MGILNASNLVIGLVKSLDEHEWLDLTGEYSESGLVYSAGDADVYLSWERLFLDRQSDYLVHFRAKPQDPWQKILIHPTYNKEWNDFAQNWEALTNTERPKLDDLVDTKTGLPKSLDKPDDEGYQKLKEIETAGCQNCPNVDLEQIQFVNPGTKQPLYAMDHPRVPGLPELTGALRAVAGQPQWLSGGWVHPVPHPAQRKGRKAGRRPAIHEG